MSNATKIANPQKNVPTTIDPEPKVIIKKIGKEARKEHRVFNIAKKAAKYALAKAYEKAIKKQIKRAVKLQLAMDKAAAKLVGKLAIKWSKDMGTVAKTSAGKMTATLLDGEMEREIAQEKQRIASQYLKLEKENTE